MNSCSICLGEYLPKYKTQKTCLDPICKKENKRQEARARADRRETKARQEKLKRPSDWKRDLQTIFNKFIRIRDEQEPCISCGRHHTGQYHAGHYRSVGSSPELRFNELNCHKQCSVCNNHLSGNLINYRINLIKKIGLASVEYLEGKHEPLKIDGEGCKRFIEYYKLKIKQLEAERLNGR